MDKAEGRGFFLMSVDAIKALQEELSTIVGPVLSGSVLFRFGFKSGFRSGEQMGLSLIGDQALDYLDESWIEMGFARPVKVEQKDGKIHVILSETLEAPIKHGKCDFTRGFLGGLVSSIFGVSYFSEEKKCSSKTGGQCHFVLKESGKKLG